MPLETLTTRPQPASSMPGRTATASAAGATTLTSKASPRSAGGMGCERGAERLNRGGVFDQDIDTARRQRGSHRTVAVLLIGEVGGQHADPPGGHAALAQQAAGLVELPGGAGEQDHP